MKVCLNCYQSIPEDERVCPYCNNKQPDVIIKQSQKNQRKISNVTQTVVAIVIVIAVALVITNWSTLFPSRTVKEYRKSYETDIEFSRIYRDYNDNEIQADERYSGKRFKLRGTVVGIENDGLLNITGGATLTVEITADTTKVLVLASFEKDQIELLKNIKKGDKITFVGTYSEAGSWDYCCLNYYEYEK